ncbi:MAG: hypothetical protein LBK63_01015 [Treponema sp.]|jgi:hypothetical protein|nr:hypothetical protein [Treponema sp.]
MKRMILSFFLFSTLCFAQLGADDSSSVVIELTPLIIEGLGPEEARFISALVQSYVADIGEVMQRSDRSLAIMDGAEGRAITMEEIRQPDFILSGSVTVEQDSRILSLKVVKVETGETVYHTSNHKTTTDLTLKVRSLVEAVFSAGLNGTFHTDASQEIMSEGKILGTWRGDIGVEIVRLQRGGRGIAILSSGAQMNLIYRIENNTLRIFQTSQNTERFYHPMPFTIARELSVRAEPWQYELFLYEDGMTLRGIKIFTDVVYEDARIIKLLPGAIREAEWTKTPR